MPLVRPKTCEGCEIHPTSLGWMPGPELNFGAKLLLVGEALGKVEAAKSKPFAGPAGSVLKSLLESEGLRREQFNIENSLRCFPAGHLAKYPVATKMAALNHCRQYSDKTLQQLQPKAVLALGATALWRMLGGEWPNIDQRRGYWEWSSQYNCWVGATYHPAFLMRGNWNLAQAWLYDIRRGLDIANGGYTQVWPEVWEDPPADAFQAWVQELAPFLTPSSDLYLDIETPHKSQMSEDELAIWGEEAILRISFAFGSHPAVSIPWAPPYLGAIRSLLDSCAVKWIWNKNFDQRKLAAAGHPLAGEVRDAMWSWHVLHPTLPKGLGYVAPFFYQHLPRWKHMAGERPAFYSAIDSEVLRGINVAVQAQLKKHRLDAFHAEHILEVDRELQRMTERGMPVDRERQRSASIKLKAELERLRGLMEEVLPVDQRRFSPTKGYQRAPEETEGLVTITVEGKVKRCAACGIDAKKAHVTKKTLSGRGKTAIVNPCFGSAIVEGMEQVQRWAKLVPFAPSNTALKRYAAASGHEAIAASGKDVDDAEGKVTFDERSLKQLIRHYSKDRLYPLVLDYRSKEKLLGYVGSVQEDGSIQGGFPTHADGRVHYVFSHGAYTFRISPQEPNISQQPRPEDEWSSLVRGCFVTEPGCVIAELDFSNIEGVLTGYFAGSERHVRLGKLGMHDFLNCHNLRRMGKITEEPLESWSDADLKALFKDTKARFPLERNAAKKTTHSAHYGITPRGLYLREPDIYRSVKEVEGLLDLYFGLFPEIRKWQWATLREAKANKFLTTPFGNRTRFWRPLKWSKNRFTGAWEEIWGEQAEETLAFRPQSTGAAILKRAIVTLRREAPEVANFIRLPNHDALVSQVPTHLQEYALTMAQAVMERPIKELPLPWNPKMWLTIGVEGKVGMEDWAHMRDWHPATELRCTA